MHINQINNFNQSFTSFRVSRAGAKELAEKFTNDNEYKNNFIEKVIQPLVYTETDVIYDGNDNVLVHPARDVATYYKILDQDLDVNSRYTNQEIKVPLMNIKTGEIIPIFVASKNTDPQKINLSSLENKFDIATRVAGVLDTANRYYEACNLSGNPETSKMFTENKLKRLFLIS